MKKVLTFMSLFIFSSALMQTFIEVPLFHITFIDLLHILWSNIFSLFFSFLISIPTTLLILKKLEFKED